MTLKLPPRKTKPPSAPSKILRRGQGKPGRRRFGGGGSISQPGPGGVPAPAVGGPQVAVPVPWNVRPPGAREINRDANGVGINAANSPFALPGASFVLPTNHVGVIRSVVLSVNNMVAASQLSWTFIINRVAIEGWNGLTIFPRAAGSVSVAYGPEETFIFLPEQSTVTVQITVAAGDALTYQGGVSYHGWSYPKSLDDSFSRIYR